MLTSNGEKRSKHIDTKFHFVKHLAERNEINVTYCPTETMIADVLTKPLNRVRFEMLRKKMGILPATDEEE
ncbi:hypothetical protein RP20_CCG015856 [Aedes albopictus]|nr:hypothetical protein RP20_CCG015856 [Aedes albopictus]